MTRSPLDSSIEMEFLVSDESPHFSHYVFKILLATDMTYVVGKSYKRKRSISSEIVVTTIFELSLRFRL